MMKEESPHQWPSGVGAVFLDSSTSRNVRNKFLFFINYPVFCYSNIKWSSVKATKNELRNTVSRIQSTITQAIKKEEKQTMLMGKDS
jgi:hypothetical protein